MPRFYVFCEDTKIRRYLVEAETAEDATVRINSGVPARGNIIRVDVTSSRRFTGDTERAESEGSTPMSRKYLRRRKARLDRAAKKREAKQRVTAFEAPEMQEIDKGVDLLGREVA